MGTYEAKKIVLGKDFWKKANGLIKVDELLVKVLRLTDGNEKPTMGFIYEAINRAKQAIQQDCRYFTELQIRHQKRMSIDGINASFNPISLDHIFEYADPLLEWLQEKENPLLDGENVGVLPMDTSDDE
ncbi:hypothetical protein Godav_027861 [Gossypium davidsonii]|uniref:Uncharacterized protein n=1 Tax=Gossypium davidsonii TaxID=34287 RepID=A0A7J8RXG1_GOSDV|nr:hypothetical protein [Gossypium davidsonii]